MDKDKLMKILEAIGIATGTTPVKKDSKFKIISVTNPKDIESVQNRKVMDVVEYLESFPTGVKYKAWTGSTEAEFFSIMFTGGLLTISLNERECDAGRNVINYGMLASLQDHLLKLSHVQAAAYLLEYNMFLYESDMNIISFNDVMTALKWEFHSDKVKVKEGMVFPT